MSDVFFRFFDGRIPMSNDFTQSNLCYILNSTLLNDKKLWSTYKVQIGTVQSIIDKNIDIKLNDYVLCPIFGDSDTFTDFQFGVTETTKRNENLYECFKRGIAEELGLRYLKDKVPDEFNDIYFYRHKYRIFFLNINDGLIPIEESKPENIIEDCRWLPKTGCVVYGCKNDILKFLNRENIVLDYNRDKIIGIVAVQLQEAIKHFM